MNWPEAARIDGMDRQILRDRMHRLNEAVPGGLTNRIALFADDKSLEQDGSAIETLKRMSRFIPDPASGDTVVPACSFQWSCGKGI